MLISFSDNSSLLQSEEIYSTLVLLTYCRLWNSNHIQLNKSRLTCFVKPTRWLSALGLEWFTAHAACRPAGSARNRRKSNTMQDERDLEVLQQWWKEKGHRTVGKQNTLLVLIFFSAIEVPNLLSWSCQ